MFRRDEGGVEKEDRAGDLNLCLVGRFITDRSIRTHIMKERMAEIWRPVKNVTIKEVVPGIFVFQFFHRLDHDKVQKGSPWAFDNYLLVLGCMILGVPIETIP